MAVIKTDKSEIYIEELNEISGETCKAFRNKNLVMVGECDTKEYGWVMCSILISYDIDDYKMGEILKKIHDSQATNGHYFFIWSYWANPSNCFFASSVTKDQRKLKLIATTILRANGVIDVLVA